MAKLTRIWVLVLISNALTWWLTRQAYRQEMARRERITARRARTLVRELKDG
ncbi:MAG: hypothetical protein IPK17_38710 [Chloroflexi bacterium]|uniref:hypothetical protein n=1 Tax=Candidatus Flexifilum breve TaxID=3140694 RepID=UPI0031347E00|nr:hypothetical protein [Chloroflexota bacterium]